MKTELASTAETGRYASVNGISLYYELHGAGSPLVLLHGGGSTIGTTFGRILPLLARKYQVIAVELQAHGHTGDRDAAETFKQDAADVAELLRQLKIPRAAIFGFSNGGQTAIEMGIRHAGRVSSLIIASAFYKRAGVPAGFWEGMKNAKFSDMPQVYKDEYLKINNDAAALMNMFQRDVQRMQTFSDWQEEDLRRIQAPALVVSGDRDLSTPEHAVELCRLLPNGRLAILPGTHGSYMGEILSPDPGSKVPGFFVALLEEFLDANGERH